MFDIVTYMVFEKRMNFISKHIHKKLPYKKVSIRLDNLLRMCPSDMKYFEQYMKDSISVHDLFTVTGAGMATAHDGFVISFRKEDLIRKISKILKVAKVWRMSCTRNSRCDVKKVGVLVLHTKVPRYYQCRGLYLFHQLSTL